MLRGATTFPTSYRHQNNQPTFALGNGTVMVWQPCTRKLVQCNKELKKFSMEHKDLLNARLNTSLLILKGAVVSGLHLRLGRSVQRIKHGKNGKGSIVFGRISESPTQDQRDEIQQYLRAMIAENAAVRVVLAAREVAEAAYGEAVLDENGIPSSVTQLRIVYIPNFVVSACGSKYLSFTGGVGEIEDLNFVHDAEKNTLEVSIKIPVSPPTEGLTLIVNPAEIITGAEGLPNLRDLVSETTQEFSLGTVHHDHGDGDLVTPWTVQAGDQGVDYDKLVIKFGCQKVSPSLLERFEKAIGQRAHHLIRRGLFFAHRDLEAICEAKEKNLPIYLYTGRGPSSEALHVGHLIPFIINKWLQEVLDCPLVIQLTDDEKFLFGQNKPLEEYHRLGYENAKDILALGFDINKTFLFRNLDYIKFLYPTILKIQKKTTLSQARGIFGFSESDNIGKIAFPGVQAAPSFPSAFPTIFPNHSTIPVRCLIPCAIDQDPYFRMTRDVAPRLGYLKPSLLLSKFIPALQGNKTKMSGSSTISAIMITDTPEIVRNKLNKYAFSGGRDTADEQRRLGANLTVDVAYQYLTFFLEDDEELERIGTSYANGEMLTGEVKSKLADVLINLLSEHSRRRAQLTDADVAAAFDFTRPQLKCTRGESLEKR